jgi:hypothetical protein
LLFISCPCSARSMSHYPTSADNTIFYQSIHSTPPRRPSAGVSRHDSLPLPTLSITQPEFSTISPGPISYKEVSDRSFIWPWHKPATDFDDREKMALVTDEKHEFPNVFMKPWEGWRVVLFSSCEPTHFPLDIATNGYQGSTYSFSSFQLP